MQCFILTATENCTLVVDSTYILTKLMEREMKVKDTGSWCMHVFFLFLFFYSV